MDLTSRFANRFADGLREAFADQQVRTLGVEIDAGEIRTIPDAFQPAVKMRQVFVIAKEAGDHDHTFTISSRNAETVVHRRGVKKEEFGPEESFLPDRNVSFSVIFETLATPRRQRRYACP